MEGDAKTVFVYILALCSVLMFSESSLSLDRRPAFAPFNYLHYMHESVSGAEQAVM